MIPCIAVSSVPFQDVASLLDLGDGVNQLKFQLNQSEIKHFYNSFYFLILMPSPAVAKSLEGKACVKLASRIRIVQGPMAGGAHKGTMTFRLNLLLSVCC